MRDIKVIVPDAVSDFRYRNAGSGSDVFSYREPPEYAGIVRSGSPDYVPSQDGWKFFSTEVYLVYVNTDSSVGNLGNYYYKLNYCGSLLTDINVLFSNFLDSDFTITNITPAVRSIPNEYPDDLPPARFVLNAILKNPISQYSSYTEDSEYSTNFKDVVSKCFILWQGACSYFDAEQEKLFSEPLTWHFGFYHSYTDSKIETCNTYADYIANLGEGPISTGVYQYTDFPTLFCNSLNLKKVQGLLTTSDNYNLDLNIFNGEPVFLAMEEQTDDQRAAIVAYKIEGSVPGALGDGIDWSNFYDGKGTLVDVNNEITQQVQSAVKNDLSNAGQNMYIPIYDKSEKDGQITIHIIKGGA